MVLLWLDIKYYLPFLKTFNPGFNSHMIALVLIIAYCFFFFFIALFSLGQLALLITYLRNKNKENIKIELNNLPKITVQLPIYNERFVIQRLLEAVSKLNYPKEKLEIQVLDDSDDDTSMLAQQLVDKLSRDAFLIEHIQRKNRIGFKAGALQNGLNLASGEYIAIFDADFIPDPNFLIDSLAYFTHEKIGMVQSRWGHLNPRASWLTRAQELGLNCHFIIDQEGRSKGGYFINFNGTAGIWRKSCIEDAGAWEADTLTEDLDLSYRAQMKGWQFNFCPDIISPAELPNQVSALKSQQFRWIKGGVETSKKLLGKLWECPLPLSKKLFGTIQLLNNYIYGFILFAGMISVPLMILKNTRTEYHLFFNWSSLFIIVLLINFFYCYISILHDKKNTLSALKEILSAYPIAVIVSMGMSYHNMIAVFKGIKGQKSAFIRTPKFNESKVYNPYSRKQKLKNYVPEMLLFIYFLTASGIGMYYLDFGFFIYHVLMTAGFGYIFYRASIE
jgi:cellulose synthase/poly-beta-1,6-N-acetylglucosamine synthase-like glycosyltransferase